MIGGEPAGRWSCNDTLANSPAASRRRSKIAATGTSHIATLLRLIVGLGLFNVWLVRAKSSTAFRGGSAKSLREEFAAYGLPDWFFFLVGALKIGSGVLLIVGIWVPEVVAPAAATVVVLMVGALSMHAKVKDPLIKCLPAFLMLLMAVSIVLLR